MRIQSILHSELQSYIDSDAYRHSDYIAISKHRALSHLRNPRAEGDDLVLVLIYDEHDEMVAYLGVFADDLHFSTGVEHVGWLSCMWVNPIMRGKGIAKKLINTVFEAWDYKILVTEFTPAAYGLYQRTEQFIDLAKPAGLRGYLRPNLNYLLTKKDVKWKKWSPLLKAVDLLLSIPNNLRLMTKRVQNCPRFEYMSELDAESWAFIQKHKQGELINRNKEDLNWLLKNPWLLNGGLQTDYNAQRYHFSSIEQQFSFLCLKVYDEHLAVQAVMLLSIRGKQMKIPYFYCSPAFIPQAIQVIYKHLLELKLDHFTVFQPQLLAQLKQEQHPFFLWRPFKRHYIIGKVMQTQLEATKGFHLQDGDADAAFT